MLTTISTAQAGPAGYAGAPVVDPRLDNGGPANSVTTMPKYGYLSDRELRAESALLGAQEQRIRDARSALAEELARRGENPIAAQPAE